MEGPMKFSSTKLWWKLWGRKPLDAKQGGTVFDMNNEMQTLLVFQKDNP